MSVIVAIREGNTVYMGADSQRSSNIRISRGFNESFYKITRFENGILAGFCGTAADKQRILSEKDIFTLDEDGALTKKHIVNSVIPKLIDMLDEISDDRGRMNVDILLTHKEKIYMISSNLKVLRCVDCVALGSGAKFTSYAMHAMKNLPVRERILCALKTAAKRADGVSGPYVLIDTKNREYEVVDLGGENH